MSKIVLNDVTNLNALSVINANFDKLEQELQSKVLYRDNPAGEPNALESDVDANGHSIYNIENLSITGGFTVDGENVGAYISQAQTAADDAEASAIAAGIAAASVGVSASNAAASAAAAAATATTVAAEVDNAEAAAISAAASAVTATNAAQTAADDVLNSVRIPTDLVGAAGQFLQVSMDEAGFELVGSVAAPVFFGFKLSTDQSSLIMDFGRDDYNVEEYATYTVLENVGFEIQKNNLVITL
jgi:hypothetical protein